MTAGGVLLLVVLLLIVRGCAGKTKSVNSSNINNATDENTTGSALSSDSEKNDSSFADGAKQTAESSSDSSDSSSDSESSDTVSTKSKHDTPVTLTISVVGDCTLGTDEAFDYSTSLNAYFENYGKEYFLQNVKSIFETDDLTIANNEGTFTDSSSREDKTFAFKAPASFAGIYSSSSVEAVNTANNHSHDYGEQSFQDTMDALDAQGIVHFGYDETAVMDIKGVKVGLVGIYELYDHLEREQQLKDNIAKVKEDGAELIIVIFHWGNEKETVPDSNQTTLGHLAIDLGADLVCGHHPHVLQGIEEYKGKNIVYSLGNFCFGGNQYPSDMDTMIFQQTFTVDQNGVKADNVTNIIPCSVSSDSDYNNYQPTPAEGDEAARILNKIQERTAMITGGATSSSDSSDSSAEDIEDSSEDSYDDSSYDEESDSYDDSYYDESYDDSYDDSYSDYDEDTSYDDSYDYSYDEE